MNDLNALLRAIILNPDEDAPRLMYADALDELLPVYVECGKCKGGKTPYCSRFMYSCAELNIPCECNSFEMCVKCEGAGQVLDTANRDRAVFIREQINRTTHERSDGYSRTSHKWEATMLAINASKWFPAAVAAYTTSPDGVPHKAERGFVSSITCTAEVFLKHADELIWHPEQKEKCAICKGHGFIAYHSEGECPKCGKPGRIGTGFSDQPRPCPDTAQPIRKVVFTNGNHWPADRYGYFDSDPDNPRLMRHTRWPGVVFDTEGSGSERVPTIGPDWLPDMNSEGI